jgi:hypothetical protein
LVLPRKSVFPGQIVFERVKSLPYLGQFRWKAAEARALLAAFAATKFLPILLEASPALKSRVSERKFARHDFCACHQPSTLPLLGICGNGGCDVRSGLAFLRLRPILNTPHSLRRSSKAGTITAKRKKRPAVRKGKSITRLRPASPPSLRGKDR